MEGGGKEGGGTEGGGGKEREGERKGGGGRERGREREREGERERGRDRWTEGWRKEPGREEAEISSRRPSTVPFRCHFANSNNSLPLAHAVISDLHSVIIGINDGTVCA